MFVNIYEIQIETSTKMHTPSSIGSNQRHGPHFIFKYVGHSNMHVNGVHVTIINSSCNEKA